MDVRKIREKVRLGESIYAMHLRVTFYARVSTEKEEQQSSLENQVEYYTCYINEHTAWTFVPGYIDEGLSGGSTKKRESFNQMIDDAGAGLFDLIITKEISRFSRNTLESIMYTRDLLDMGVCVMFQNDGINTLDTDSEFRLIIMAGIAQDEIRKLSERLKFGFRQSIKNGRVLGNNRMYGYNKKDCRLEINEEQAAVVRTIFDLYANQGMGFRRIARYVYDNLGVTSYQGNQFNVKTVQNIICNPKYKGFYCANKTRSTDYRTHKYERLDKSEWVLYKDESIPAIVSEELWERANEILKYRSSKATGYSSACQNRYPYSGKLVCAVHKASYHRSTFKTKSGENEQWVCKVYKNLGKAACPAPKLKTSEIDFILSGIFSSMNMDKKALIGKVVSLIRSVSCGEDFPAELAAIHGEINTIAKKKEKLFEMLVDDIISKIEFKELNDKLNEMARRAGERADSMEKERVKSKNDAENFENIRNALEKELIFEEGISSEVVTTILDKIAVHTTDDDRRVKLDIYLKSGDVIPYEFNRTKKSSACSNTSLLCAPQGADCVL